MASAVIERIPCIPREDFYRRYVAPSKPVVIEGLATRWPAFSRWSAEYLVERIGDERYSVLTHWKDGFVLGRDDTPFRDFARDHFSDEGAGRRYLAQGRLPPALEHDVSFPNYIDPQHAPPPNLWLGPKGSITALHYDAAHNLSVQIAGHKRFVLFPIEDHPLLYLYESFPPNPIPSAIDLTEPDLMRFPLLADAHPLEVVLAPGEVLFLPGGWLHFVEGLDRTISVNQWWLCQSRYLLETKLVASGRSYMLDSLGHSARSLAQFSDVSGQDELDLVALLWETGYRARAVQSLYALTLELLEQLEIKLHCGVAYRLPAKAPLPSQQRRSLLRSREWTTAWTPSDRHAVVDRARALRAQEALSAQDHDLLLAFLEVEGGDDGSFDSNVAARIDVRELFTVVRRVARDHELLGLFAPYALPSLSSDLAPKSSNAG